MSDRTLSQDLAALAFAVAAVSPELADRAAALEADVAALRCDEAQWQSELDAANNRAAFAESEAQRRLAIAERRLAALNRHRDGIHDSAACFELPMPDWCYPLLGSLLGRFGPAEQLADALEIADQVRAAGGGDAEVEAALDAERAKAAQQILAAQERGDDA